MKKRILSMLLAPILLFSMAVPGFAAENSDSANRLAAVTGKVKAALALDTEQYTDFSGRLTEGELAPTWQLNWSGEGGSLEITASESGKILSYYRFDEDDARDSAPLSLPKGSPAKAKAAAAAFLKQVLDSTETVDLDAAAQSNSLRQIRYYFRGTVLLNSCPSPLNFFLVVRASDHTVVQFHRDNLETGYIGAVPSATFQMRQSAVEPLLLNTLSLRLEYVLDEGQDTAVLRYLPNTTDSFYVDDASGKLVNLTQLYEELGRDGADADKEDEVTSSPSGGAGDNGGSLTQAEQLGADKLKGTLNKEALDQKARSISQLGLDSYTLASVSYQEEDPAQDAPVITARLSYAKRADEKTLHRWVTVNAKTGELMSVYSSRPWSGEDSKKVGDDAARSTAEAFLSAHQKERFALCAAYTGNPAANQENGRYGTWSFRYVRQENGYFFPDNQFVIGIDAVDGSVCTYSQSWSEDVSFDSPDGIVSAQQAVDAYFKTFQITKGYVAVPQKLDLSNPDYAPLAEMGYRALNSLKLGWQLTASKENVTGIDAKTGRPVFWTSQESDSLQYNDLTGSWAQNAAEALADYGIGYAGGMLRPDKKLTQLDLAALLASTQGVLIDPDHLTDGDADRVYRAAYSMGALQRENRSDSQVLSRIEVIKILLDAGGYGPVAQLQGIYRTDFPDESKIPENLLGYAALAQAMGVVQGDRAGCLNPSQSATRADTVVMLYAFMQRN